MPQSLSKLLVHIVFSTKYREPFLHDRVIRERVHAYLAGVCNANGSHALIVGGVADHVHILCDLSRTKTVAELVGEVKRSSSKWIKALSKDLTQFAWQNGYGAFSVGRSGERVVMNYIRNQETHHAARSFKEEFRGVLEKYRVDHDERYVWD